MKKTLGHQMCCNHAAFAWISDWFEWKLLPMLDYQRHLERSRANKKLRLLPFLMHSLTKCKHLHCQCKRTWTLVLLAGAHIEFLETVNSCKVIVWTQIQKPGYLYPNDPCVSTGRKRVLKGINHWISQSASDSRGTGEYWRITMDRQKSKMMQK